MDTDDHGLKRKWDQEDDGKSGAGDAGSDCGDEGASDGSGGSDSADYCPSCGNLTYVFADACPIQDHDVVAEWAEWNEHVINTYSDPTEFNGLDFFTLFECYKMGVL